MVMARCTGERTHTMLCLYLMASSLWKKMNHSEHYTLCIVFLRAHTCDSILV